ncbi:MAG: ABC transporter ATP-binding protein [Candidatus Methanomethylophilaceae archaeon]
MNNLTLKIKRGSFTGLLGPNGAGKSTTLKMLTHLIKATSGEAYINGVDVTKDPKAALTGVGTVVETPEFYTYLTPVETFKLIGQVIGMNPESISAETSSILETVKMAEWQDKKIGTFSKGMRQRIALGQAFLGDPNVIILDEPTSGLDPRGMAEIRQVLKNIRSGRDVTVVMSSHMLHEVSDLCDRVAILDHGKLVFEDSTDAVSSVTGARQLIIKTNRQITDAEISRISGLSGVLNAVGNGAEINLTVESGSFRNPEFFRKVGELDIGAYGMREGASLESTYLSLVKESR